jgi:HEPN domain-containing protein
LLKSGHYPGAYYLMGYAVESALKACVAKQVKRYDFPNKKLANEVFTHDLGTLMRGAGLWVPFEAEMKANPPLQLNWAIVKDWSVEDRYEVTVTEPEAADLYSACTARNNGVLPWIKGRW